MAEPGSHEPVTGKYGLDRLDKIWRELRDAQRRNCLPVPDACPGFVRPSCNKELKRLRRALLDDSLGLGMQLRWCLALIALDGKPITTGRRACTDARESVVSACKLEENFHRPGSASGDDDRVTQEEPYDPRHFLWTYFVVMGTARLTALGEYQQPALDLPAIDLNDFDHVLKATGFDHIDAICSAMPQRTEAPTEAAICLYEQIRRLESIQAQRGDVLVTTDFSALTRFGGLGELVRRFVERLDDRRRRLEQAVLLITAFAIGGVKRATVIRCLMLWPSVFPKLTIDGVPDSIDAWNAFFDTWLRTFSAIVKSGADERWREIDPQRHPFEYTGSLLFNITCDRKEWWNESIDFSIADVRNAIVSHIQNNDWQLAEGIHRIVAEEALRQHTMVLRHSARSDRLTMRSSRRGLQALYHSLMSLPQRIDAVSRDEKIDPALHFNASLPAQHLQRFKYIYYGLLPALLRDETTGHFATAWGAEAIKLEIALFADKLLFRPPRGTAHTLLSQSMIDSHYNGLALAAVRTSPHAGWSEVRTRLRESVPAQRSAGSLPALVDKVLLQMNIIECGPEAEETGSMLTGMKAQLGLQLHAFDASVWQAEDGSQAAFPTATLFRQLVTDQLAAVADENMGRKSDISTLLFIVGVIGADSEEAHLDDGRVRDDRRRRTSHLLKCFAALVAGSQMMWQGYGEEHCPLPYLAAEGLRNLCRAGLEILRVMQKNRAQVFLDSQEEVEALVTLVTSRVRTTLDDYTRVFSTNESERTHMLILEARFARLASICDPVWKLVAKPLDMLEQPYPANWPAAAERRRYEVALTFLGEAEANLLNFDATDALRIRLLSERCSTLRYLAMNLARHVHVDPEVPDKTALLERARMCCNLALLDVQQMKNIIARPSAAQPVWLPSSTKGKWSATADYHEAALQQLHAKLAARAGGRHPGHPGGRYLH